MSNALVNGSGKTPLRIGAVQFRTEECPRMLPIGAGEQMLSKTQLVGGGRISNSFGFDPYDVTWDGTFYTIANVFAKVRALRLYAVGGQEVLLSWWGERYFCIVKAFTPKYNHENLSGYSITVQITRDANGAFALASPTSIDAQVQALLASTTAMLATIAGSRTVTIEGNTFTFLSNSVSNLNATVQAAVPIASQITTSGPAVADAANDTATAAGNYAAAIGESDPNYGNTLALQGSAQAIAANATRGQSPQTLTVQGGSLFTTAAQQYGDVTQAFTLASVNRLPSVFLSATQPTSAKLPPLQVASGFVTSLNQPLLQTHG